MSCKEYRAVYDKMTDQQKKAMWDLWMSGVNYDGHSWVTYGEVEKCVAKLFEVTGTTMMNARY